MIKFSNFRLFIWWILLHRIWYSKYFECILKQKFLIKFYFNKSFWNLLFIFFGKIKKLYLLENNKFYYSFLVSFFLSLSLSFYSLLFFFSHSLSYLYSIHLLEIPMRSIMKPFLTGRILPGSTGSSLKTNLIPYICIMWELKKITFV